MLHVLEEKSRTSLQDYKIIVTVFIAAICHFQLYEVIKVRHLCGLR
jgi:hypothetical protein